MKILKKDYIKILKYYKKHYRNNDSYAKIKKKAEDLMAGKLCRCIKTLGDNKDAIGICTNSILKKKNISSNKFTCKKKPRFRANLSKTKRNLKLK
jgi:hypothetical protein